MILETLNYYYTFLHHRVRWKYRHNYDLILLSEHLKHKSENPLFHIICNIVYLFRSSFLIYDGTTEFLSEDGLTFVKSTLRCAFTKESDDEIEKIEPPSKSYNLFVKLVKSISRKI